MSRKNIKKFKVFYKSLSQCVLSPADLFDDPLPEGNLNIKYITISTPIGISSDHIIFIIFEI